jgi:hypothetical protein
LAAVGQAQLDLVGRQLAVDQLTVSSRGGSQRRISPPALPCRLNLPPTRRSPVTGRNQRLSRSGSVQASQTSWIGAS